MRLFLGHALSISRAFRGILYGPSNPSHEQVKSLSPAVQQQHKQQYEEEPAVNLWLFWMHTQMNISESPKRLTW